MTRDGLLTRFEATPCPPWAKVDCRRLIELLPDGAFGDPSRVTMVAADRDGAEVAVDRASCFVLVWTRTKPHSYLSASLCFKAGGYGGFEVTLSRTMHDTVESTFMIHADEAPRILADLFAAYLAD